MKLLAHLVAVALIVVLAGGCGCGKSPEEEASDILMDKGGAKAEVVELAKKGLPHLKELLKSTSSTTRLAAIQAIGLLKNNQEATQILIDLTTSDDYNEPWAAVLALGVQGSPEAKEIIKQAMASPNARLREGACVAIYEYGDKELYPLLDKALRDKEMAVRNAAAIARERLSAGQ